MRTRETLVGAVFCTGFLWAGCSFLQGERLLHATARTSTATSAVQHNEQGITAYEQGRLQEAIEHFEAAVQASPVLAEAHYNLGMVLYKMGQEDVAYPHFMKAANLEPGNDVIQSAPPLRGVQRPSGGGSGPALSDGHSHTH